MSKTYTFKLSRTEVAQVEVKLVPEDSYNALSTTVYQLDTVDTDEITEFIEEEIYGIMRDSTEDAIEIFRNQSVSDYIQACIDSEEYFENGDWLDYVSIDSDTWQGVQLSSMGQVDLTSYTDNPIAKTLNAFRDKYQLSVETPDQKDVKGLLGQLQALDTPLSDITDDLLGL